MKAVCTWMLFFVPTFPTKYKTVS